jgi:adenylate cyclase
MDWDAEGLLEGLEDDDARDARRRLLDHLHEDGCDVDELRRAIEEDRLVLLPVERQIAGEIRHSQRDIAEEVGLEVEQLGQLRQALGLAVPESDTAKVFTEEDLATAKDAAALQKVGFPFEDTIEVTRVLGLGMSRYAEALRVLFAQTFIEPGDTEFDLARRLEGAAGELMPLSSRMLDHVFLLHLRQLLRSDYIGLAERTSGRLEDTSDQAVAFADLVGFTELGETVDVEQLGSLAGRLARVAAAVVEPPVRVVKQIGDAVMLVSPDVAATLETCLALIARAEDEDDFPPLRAGVAYGPVVNRWGDWFGSTVNVASRLTARARPGAVLTTADVREAAEDRFDWSAAGEKKLKGLNKPLTTFRARPRGTKQEDDGKKG